MPMTEVPPSCNAGDAGVESCLGGDAGTESCCTSLEVPGGMFNRDDNSSYPATVGGFRLDKYDVTVGRFRSFIDAGLSAWSPATGSGIHKHLNGGHGLLNSGTTPPEYETGWQSSWSSNLATTVSQWTTTLACDSTYATWTPSPGANEKLPINCVDWYEAYAFCIWDGGFLPSEAEFDYVYMGGSLEHTYPWGNKAPGPDPSLAVYGCYYPNATGICTGLKNIAPVGSVKAGDGVWGQSDLAGEMWQWLLDWYENPYSTKSCVDCADTTDANAKYPVLRGGAFNGNSSELPVTCRCTTTRTNRVDNFGFRCARTP